MRFKIHLFRHGLVYLRLTMYAQFAWRYFKSKKSTNAINIISWVSISAIAVGTAALIILLSVFNGLEGFIKSLYNDFYPDISITAVEGKSFAFSPYQIQQLEKLDGIKVISPSLEEKVLLTYNGEQTLATIKGISKNYNEVTNVKEAVNYGTMDFETKMSVTPVVLGLGVANKLGVSEESPLPITVLSFKNVQSYNLNALNAFSQRDLFVQGVFYLQEEIDEKYAFAQMEVVQQLLGREDEYSTIEIALDEGVTSNSIKTAIAKVLGNNKLKVETRFEQNKTLFLILRSERWAVYAVLSLMLIIASFNIIGSLSMLVLDKEKDIAILQAMGAKKNFVRNLFLSIGVFLSLMGASIGCLIAFTICFLQQQFGLVTMGTGDNFLVEAYPVQIHIGDFVLVMITVIIISVLASYWPALKASRKNIELRTR